MNKEQNLTTFCEAIRDFEGWSEGSRSFRNCNPGNLKGLTDYTKSLGATSVDKDNFCIFPDYNTGFNALKTLVKDASLNKLKAYHDCSIFTFFKVYAPSYDKNNPSIYAQFVSRKVGVDMSAKLKDIL